MMTEIKYDEKRESYYFVHDAGRNPITGKRKQIRRTGFKNQTEAKRALKQVILDSEKIRNIPTNLANMSFEEFTTQWLESKKVSLRANTYYTKVRMFKNDVYPYIGDIKMKHINNELLQEFINKLSNKITIKGTKISNVTVNRNWVATKEVLKYACRKKILDPNELEGLYTPNGSKDFTVWNNEEIKKFLYYPNVADKLPRYYVGYAMALLTGMRMGEVLGLRWKDISFAKSTITINQTLVLCSDKTVYKLESRTKTSGSKATILMPKSLSDMLKSHLELIESDKRKYAKSYIDNDLVVCTRYGTPVIPSCFRKSFKNFIQELELPNIRFHDLRHTHATFLMSEGVSPKIIQERLRHSDIKTTLGTYSHALPHMHIDAIDKFDQITD